jgi:predicted aspartyl protease
MTGMNKQDNQEDKTMRFIRAFIKLWSVFIGQISNTMTIRALGAHLMLAFSIFASQADAQMTGDLAASLPKLSDLLQPLQPAKPEGCTVVADAQMPLMPSQERFVTPVVIDQQALMMLVDSGSGGTALSPRMAASLHLDEDTDRRVRVNGSGGQMDAQYPVVLHSLRFGSVNLVDYDVLTVNIVRPERENDASSAVGLIGADLLSRFDVELDFPNHRLTLYRVSSCSGRFVPWTGAYDSFMASRTARKGFIIPVVLNGTSVRALVDTGSNISSIGRESASAVGVDAQTLANEPAGSFVGAKGNAVTAHKHLFQTMAVGASTFRNARIFVQDASFPGIDMLLGMDFLRTRKVWLSYSTNQVFIQSVPRQRLPVMPVTVPEKVPAIHDAPESTAPAAPSVPGVTAIDDISAIPYLSEKGRQVYRNTFLTHSGPRAFVVSSKGSFSIAFFHEPPMSGGFSGACLNGVGDWHKLAPQLTG